MPPEITHGGGGIMDFPCDDPASQGTPREQLERLRKQIKKKLSTNNKMQGCVTFRTMRDKHFYFSMRKGRIHCCVNNLRVYSISHFRISPSRRGVRHRCQIFHGHVEISFYQLKQCPIIAKKPSAAQMIMPKLVLARS